MKKIFSLLLLALIVHCQSPLKRLSKESPESTFLFIDDSNVPTENWQRVLGFLSMDKCIKQDLDNKILFQCDSSVKDFLKSLSNQGYLIQETDSAYLLTTSQQESQEKKSNQELSERLDKLIEPIGSFTQGNWKIALDAISQNTYSNSQDFLSIKKVMDGRIQIQKKRTLDILTSMTESTKDSIGKERNFFQNFNPYFNEDQEFKESAQKFLQAYHMPETLSCRVDIMEPNSQPYVTIGFEENVNGQLVCNRNFSRPLEFQISGNEYLKIGDYASNQEEFDLENGDNFTFSVNALSMNSEQNKLKFHLKVNYAKTIDKLKFLSPEYSNSVKLENEYYQFQSAPNSFSPAYEELSSRFLNPELSTIGSLENGRIKTTILSNGMFSLGGSNSSGNFDLTFGHPNGVYAEGIWSSYTSLKINDEVIQLNDYPTEILEQSDTSLETITSLANHEIDVKITWETNPEQKNSIRLSYEISNLSSQSKDVGIRILMDTWAGHSDGVPFTLPGSVEYANRIITNEISFNSNISPNWETTEFNSSGEVFLQNTMIGDNLVAPDEIQLVNWGSAFGNNWDYLISESRDVTGDSAVVLRWNQKKIEPKQTRMVATQFSSIERKQDVTFDLLSTKTGNGILNINKKDPNCKKISLEYSVQGGRVLDSNGKSKSEYILNDTDSSALISVPLTVYSTGNTILDIKETCSGITKTHSISLSLQEEDQFNQPNLFVSSTAIPVQFSTKSSGQKIEARLIDPITNQKIDSVVLKESKANNLYTYTGTLNPKNNGNYVIEYVDLSASQPTSKQSESPKLEKGYAKVTKRSGDTIIGKITDQDKDQLNLETKSGTIKILKREIKSVKYGR